MTAVSPVTHTVNQQQVDAYAEASGDHNPIHVDAAFAASTPFGGTIAHGMLVLAFIAEMMHQAHGQEWLRSGRMKVRFKAPTRAGETVTASASAAKEGPEVIEYAVKCTTGADDVVIEGRASVASR